MLFLTNNTLKDKSIPFPDQSQYIDEFEDEDDYTAIYLLFSGRNIIPLGGWDDFKGHFPTVDLAVAFLNKEVDIYERQWFQIVNIETRHVVMSEDKPYTHG